VLRKIIGVALSAVFVLAGGYAAAADKTSPVLAQIAKSGELRVAMTAEQPPFNMRNKEGKLIGFEVELAKMLAGAIGVELKVVERPFSELLTAVQKGEADLVMSGMTSTLERNMQVAFVGPYYVSGKSILTKSSTIAAAQQSEEVNQENIRVAALKGSTSEIFVELAMPKAQFTATTNHQAAIDMLINGEVDAVVADAPILLLTMLRYPDAGLTTLKKPLTVEPIGIAVAPGDPLLLNLLQNYLNAAQATGALDLLTKKWFKSGAWLVQLP
jgi:polar amino acid transport system substrate-binding protein